MVVSEFPPIEMLCVKRKFMFEQELEVPNYTDEILIVWEAPWAFEVRIAAGVVCVLTRQPF